MTDPGFQKDGEGLLFAIARRAIDYARVGNKGGLIRLRYLARQIVDIMPFGRRLRLSDLSTGEEPRQDAAKPVRKRRR
ncbi:hypothetical protein M0208_12035 [Sphingomonas sp. SUN019]|uniref:hypothetical protein n=1 Tax=Sphingomonas sp. SUN019 TaxID=2937788 RepID=UPI0021642F9F|nr:hypothetical protein [Sphingomonas sp. SUN019]UVO51202.1 hypothetical protein M0208_12035 [Sphingomonas sp. SUN019]